MSETTNKVRSRTRLDVRGLPPELLGRTVMESRERYAGLCEPHSTQVVYGSLPGALMESGFLPLSEWGWCDLPFVGSARPSWIVVRTVATTPTSLDPMEDWQDAALEAESLQRAESLAESKTAATAPDEELELYIRPEPRNVRKVTARIVRRTRGEPNPILE